MVRVVLWVLDGHVLEQSVIYSEDVIRPVPDLLFILPHSPCTPILQPQLKTWVKVQAHVLYTCRRELICNGLTPWCAFRLCKIDIKVTGYQEIGSVRSSLDSCRDILYGWCFARGNIELHNIPPPLPCHQLKYDDVWAVGVELFDRNSSTSH